MSIIRLVPSAITEPLAREVFLWTPFSNGVKMELNNMLEPKFDHKSIEKRIYEMWESGGYFTATRDPEKKPYTILLPPPNASGKMHTGNVLMIAIEDLLVRWKRMQGYSALYVPGTDHAGFETQYVYEKELARQIVADGLEVINGTKKIAELHTSAISLLDNVTIESLERYEEVQFDLNGLLDFTDPKNLYPFRLPGLQEKILGAGPGNFVIVFARPECYTYETEILTESGWIQFQDLKDNIKVAQVLPNNLIEFVYPIKKVNYHYNGKLINFKADANLEFLCCG